MKLREDIGREMPMEIKGGFYNHMPTDFDFDLYGKMNTLLDLRKYKETKEFLFGSADQALSNQLRNELSNL